MAHKSDMANTVEWVSDELYDILGLSDHYTGEFLVGLAKKTSSSDIFLSQLQDTGAITINDSVRDFASQLIGSIYYNNNNIIDRQYIVSLYYS